MAATAGLGFLIGASRWRDLEQAERWITLYLLGSAVLQVVQIFGRLSGLDRGAIFNLWISWAILSLFSALIESSAKHLRKPLKLGQRSLLAAWAIYFMFGAPLNSYFHVIHVVFALAATILALLAIFHGIDAEDDQALWIGGAMLLVEAADIYAFAYLAGWIPATSNVVIAAWILRNVCWINAHLCFIRNLRCMSPSSSSFSH